MLKKDFLKHFRPPSEEDWIEASAGRAAALRLSGPQGNLDIITVYLHTGPAKAERDQIRAAMGRIIRPPDEALTVTIGDWNFVRVENDRAQLVEQAWSRTNG